MTQWVIGLVCSIIMGIILSSVAGHTLWKMGDEIAKLKKDMEYYRQFINDKLMKYSIDTQALAFKSEQWEILVKRVLEHGKFVYKDGDILRFYNRHGDWSFCRKEDKEETQVFLSNGSFIHEIQGVKWRGLYVDAGAVMEKFSWGAVKDFKLNN